MMELWTAATPNGWKVNIMVEELIEAGIEMPEMKIRSINLSKGEQFTDEFTEKNPNQKIPVLIDDTRSIMESCAILQYLGEKYPSPLLPSGDTRWDVIPWVYWQAANVGPNFGNKLSYTRYMDDVDPLKKEHPLERFNKEALRLMAVLANQLKKHDWVCGDNFTIADISIYPWVRGYKWSKIDITQYPEVPKWVERVRARPGVERGLSYGVPKDEIDKWSAERKAQYRKNGATIASNENLNTEI